MRNERLPETGSRRSGIHNTALDGRESVDGGDYFGSGGMSYSRNPGDTGGNSCTKRERWEREDMKRLTKTEIRTKETLAGALQECFQDLQEACEAYNAATDKNDAKGPVEASIMAYNANLENATAFCEGIVAKIDEYVEARSEAWQESDKASEYESWKEQWEQVAEFDEVTVEALDSDGELDTSCLENDGETLAGIADEVGG